MSLNFHQQELKDDLDSFTQVKHLKAGDEILRENSYVRMIPVLNSGLLGVYRTDEDGREILLYYIKPGESCIMSFLAGISDDTSKVRAIAEEDSELVLVPVEKAKEWVHKYPEWIDYIFKLYHQRFEELLEVVNSIAFQKMDERIWKQLMKKSEISGSKEINITHQQLATEIGTSREVVSRLLKQMEKEGIIALGRNKLTLLK
jgi:CRP/FNR family transcriptional regulator